MTRERLGIANTPERWRRLCALAATVLCLALALVACGSGGESSSSANPSVTVAEEAGPRVKPLEVTGGGAAPFRVKGGDNSIQDYGHESGSGELRRAALAVHGYYAALAREMWAEACGRLTPATAAAATRLAAPAKGQGCAVALGALFGPVTPAEGREATAVDAASLRRKGSQGFLLYRGAGRKPYFISLELLHYRWAVSNLSPTGLP